MSISSVLRIIRLFSLDIVAGAIAALVFSSTVMGTQLHRGYYLIMGITVWLIYTVDHLMDGAKSGGKSEVYSRNFFFHNRVPIILAVLLLLVFDFRLIIYRLDEKIIEFAMGPGIAVMVYLVLNRFYGNSSKWFFIKEVWITIIYTLAIWGGPVIYAGDIISLPQMMIIGSFGLIIFGNVLIYSIYERETDELEGHRSFVSDFGLKTTVNTAVYSTVVSIILALSAVIMLHSDLLYSIPLVLIATGLLLILSYPGIFGIRQRYGIIADLLLLLFLLVLTGRSV
jgi:4-hydroxybenzoate polyprenyltransferase